MCFLAQGQGKKYILVTSKGSRALVGYDYQTLDYFKSLDVAKDGHEMVVDAQNEHKDHL